MCTKDLCKLGAYLHIYAIIMYVDPGTIGFMWFCWSFL